MLPGLGLIPLGFLNEDLWFLIAIGFVFYFVGFVIFLVKCAINSALPNSETTKRLSKIYSTTQFRELISRLKKTRPKITINA